MTDSPRPPFIRYSDGTIDQGRTVEPQAILLDRVAGLDMTIIYVDHRTTLQFGDFGVVIGTPFRLTTPDGTEHNLDPEVRVSLGPVLDLYPDTLLTATVDADASLRLCFTSGATLDVPADNDFEAWQVNGSDGFLVVCTPGGDELSVWGSPEE